MASEKIAFNYVHVQEIKTNPVFLARIVRKRGIDRQRLEFMMKYNVLSIKQLSDITGMNVSSIERKTRPTIVTDKRDGEVIIRQPILTAVFPFFTLSGLGFKFILRDESCEKFIKSFYLQKVNEDI